MELEIKEDEWEGRIVLITEEGNFVIELDDVTGDWYVCGQREEHIQGHWMDSKQDAINFALGKLGVLENPNYQRAPDRTSA